MAGTIEQAPFLPIIYGWHQFRQALFTALITESALLV